MSRIALVAGPDPGHAFPMAALAGPLIERGHDVVVMTGDDRKEDLVRAGLPFASLPLEWPDERHADLGYRLWDLAGRLAPATADALADHDPDVVLVDTLTQSGAFAAELRGRPWIEVIPHHLTDPDPAIPPVGLGRRPARHPVRRADDQRLQRRIGRSLATGRAQRGRVRDALGLGGDGRSALRLVASFPALEHPRSRWPGDAHLVGSLGWDPPWPELPVPPGRDPLVVVADSSASTVPWRLGERALVALRHTGLRVVVVTRDDLRAPTDRCVVGWGPHGPLVDRAAVVVTVGGAGVLGKAVVRGVPLVVVPVHGDQHEAAVRVVHAGIGRRVGPLQRTARHLRTAVLRVVADDRHRERAAEVAAEGAELGPERAATLVEAVLAGRRPVARGPVR